MDKNSKVVKFKQTKKNENTRHGFSLYQEGLIFYDEDKRDLALKKFLEAEQEGYESVDLFCNLAWLYQDKGDLQKVEYYVQKALKCDKEYGRCYALLGDIYFNRQTPDDAEKALSCYQKAIDYDYGNDYIYLRVTIIYYTYQNNYLKALEAINKAIELDPKKGHYYAFKAEIYANMNETKLAIKYYLKALELGYGVNDIDIYSIVSDLYSDEGDFEKALEYANKVIFIDKSNGEGYYKKGFAYYNAGDFKHAEAPLLIAEEKGIEEAKLYSTLSFIYCEKKDSEKAFYYADKAIKTDKKDSVGYWAMIQVLYTQREHRQAFEWIKKTYKLFSNTDFPEFAYAYYVSYLVLFHRYKSALKIIDEGLKSYPNSTELLKQKFGLLLYKKKIDEAKNVLKNFIEINPTAISTLQLQIYMDIELKQYDKALNSLATIDTTKEISDEDMLTHSWLYLESYFKIKNYKKCLEYFDKYIKNPYFSDIAVIDYKKIKHIYTKLQNKFPNDERTIFISSKMLELQDLIDKLEL